MNEKVWFAALRHPVPDDMEFYLEKMAAEGKMLCPVGQMGLFYYEFIDDAPQKCKYMVDVTRLPKALYMDTLISEGWYFLGQSGNCYIWRQPYDEHRPKEMGDRTCKERHCRNLGLVFLFMALICIVAAFLLCRGFYLEIQYKAVTRHVSYIVEAALQIPFIGYFLWASHRLLTGKK